MSIHFDTKIRSLKGVENFQPLIIIFLKKNHVDIDNKTKFNKMGKNRLRKYLKENNFVVFFKYIYI